MKKIEIELERDYYKSVVQNISDDIEEYIRLRKDNQVDSSDVFALLGTIMHLSNCDVNTENIDFILKRVHDANYFYRLKELESYKKYAMEIQYR